MPLFSQNNALDGIRTFIAGSLGQREKLKLVAIAAIAILSATFSAIAPYLLSLLTKWMELARFKQGTLPAGIIIVVSAYLACMGLTRFFSLITLRLQSTLRLDVINRLSKQFFKFLCNQDTGYFVKKSTGELSQSLNQASNDAFILVRALSSNVISPVFQLLVALSILLASGEWAVGGAFLLYAFIFLKVNLRMGRNLIELRLATLQTGRKSYATLIDSVSNISVVRDFGSFNFFFERYQAVINDDRSSQMKYWGSSVWLGAINALLFVILFSFSFAWVIWNVWKGATPISHIVLVGGYIFSLTAPIEGLGSMFTDVNQSATSLLKFFSGMSKNGENHEQGRVTVSLGETTQMTEERAPAISLRNVKMKYPGNNDDVLKDISLCVSSGEHVAIIGPSGSGKSTLLKVLQGIYPAEGEIEIFGHPIQTLSLNERSELIGVISQEAFTFNDTLRFNLQIANPEKSDSDFTQALTSAGLNEFLDSLPKGLDTVLGERGSTLSGGQRQRLSLARIFLRSPEIILIDEATSALDMMTEKAVIDTLYRSFDGKAIVAISHRNTAINFADKIYVIETGSVTAAGTASELRQLPGFFSDVEALYRRL